MVEVSSPKVFKPTDALRLIVFTAFIPLDRLTPATLNTKEEFSITQDFEQTFQLDPDEPRIFVELINASYTSIQNNRWVNVTSMFVRLTLFIDDEVEYDERKLLTSGSRTSITQSFSREDITFL